MHVLSISDNFSLRNLVRPKEMSTPFCFQARILKFLAMMWNRLETARKQGESVRKNREHIFIGSWLPSTYAVIICIHDHRCTLFQPSECIHKGYSILQELSNWISLVTTPEATHQQVQSNQDTVSKNGHFLVCLCWSIPITQSRVLASSSHNLMVGLGQLLEALPQSQAGITNPTNQPM